ncbi:MAG: MarP family serine protease [Acidimicrobiia bacterium]
MNGLDVVILAVLAVSVYGGWRVGFTARSLSWAGLILGVLVGVAFLDSVIDLFDGSTPEIRLLAGTMFALGLGVGGQALGALLARVVPRPRPQGAARRFDQFAGALAGAAGLAVLLWLLAPALLGAPGRTAGAARDSAVLDALARYAPDSPDSLTALSDLSGESVFPQVFGDAGDPPDAGEIPELALPPDVEDAVSASTVKIVGQACRQIQEGTGFAVGDDLVVTNAHVVAGESRTEILTGDGRRLTGDVALFDPDRDLAVVRVRGLELAALTLADGEVGSVGAVFGHPGGRDLRAAPARIADEIQALGTDIYEADDTERSVYVLAAALEPGDSGGPLVDGSGAVVGVAFAVDPTDDEVAYALTNAEVDAVRDDIAPDRVDTGECVVP